VELVLGIVGIVVAVVFGVVPLIQKYKEREEQKRRSQTLLTPVNIPGSLQLRNVMDTEPVFMLELENIGSNQCRDVEGRLQSYNLNDINGVNERPIPAIDQKVYATNPIGANQRWIIELSRLALEQSGVHDIHIMASGTKMEILDVTEEAGVYNG